MRIQAVPWILDEYKGVACYITEKLDGQSASYVYNKNKFMVCSRNIEVKERNSNYWKIAEKYNKKVVAIGGVHVDNATKDEINLLVENCKELVKCI